MKTSDGSERPDGGVAIVVVNFRSHELIRSNIVESSLNDTEAEFVIVDSFSTDDEQRAVSDMCADVGWRCVPLTHNPGFGAAANEGAREAIASGCDTLVFLNPDARLSIDGLQTLTELSRAEPNRMLSPVVTRPNGSVWFDGAVTDRRTGMPGREPLPADRIPWLSGACLTVSSKCWVDLDGFDDRYFMYWEDVDLSFRCVQHGGDLAVVESVTVVHDVGGTQGGGKSGLYVRYCSRNRLLFAAQHLGRREIIRWILATPRASWLIARRAGPRRELIRSPRLLAAMLSGSFEGLWAACSRVILP